MSIEREYIKELLQELEKAEDYERKYKDMVNYEAGLNEEIRSLKKEINDLKTKVKKPYTRTTITNPQTIDIFEALKKGELFEFIKPLENKRYTQYKTNPFIFRYDNKGAVFEGKLLGVFEERNNNRYYYHQNLTENRSMLGEILRQVIGIYDDTRDCSLVKLGSSKKGKCLKDMTTKDILKMNPVVNILKNKLVSSKNKKFIYTKNDGSKYIILENGSEEIV